MRSQLRVKCDALADRNCTLRKELNYIFAGQDPKISAGQQAAKGSEDDPHSCVPEEHPVATGSEEDPRSKGPEEKPVAKWPEEDPHPKGPEEDIPLMSVIALEKNQTNVRQAYQVADRQYTVMYRDRHHLRKCGTEVADRQVSKGVVIMQASYDSCFSAVKKDNTLL